MPNDNRTRPPLSFDGKGINGPDEYRSRVATFANSEAAQEWGPMLAAAPELLEALHAVMDDVIDAEFTASVRTSKAWRQAFAAIAKATGE